MAALYLSGKRALQNYQCNRPISDHDEKKCFFTGGGPLVQSSRTLLRFFSTGKNNVAKCDFGGAGSKSKTGGLTNGTVNQVNLGGHLRDNVSVGTKFSAQPSP